MRILSPAELSPLVRFSPRPDRTIEDGAVLFTLLDLSQIVGEGRIDLEGFPEDLARTVKRPAKVAEGGAAGEGWWELAAGTYLARFNERVRTPPGSLLLVQPHPRLVQNGAWHLPVFWRTPEEQERGLLLVVGSKGVKVRENAPVSLATVLAGV